MHAFAQRMYMTKYTSLRLHRDTHTLLKKYKLRGHSADAFLRELLTLKGDN